MCQPSRHVSTLRMHFFQASNGLYLVSCHYQSYRLGKNSLIVLGTLLHPPSCYTVESEAGKQS